VAPTRFFPKKIEENGYSSPQREVIVSTWFMIDDTSPLALLDLSCQLSGTSLPFFVLRIDKTGYIETLII
jgi:hypothetical protein